MEEQSIYSDGLVEVSQIGIRFRRYYFPFGTKFARFSDISTIEKRLPTISNGKWRLWGTGDFLTWFPLDWNRPKRDFIFLIRLSSQRTRIGFTVENTKLFIEAVESKGIKIGNP